MSDRLRIGISWVVVLLLALAFTVVPGGGNALDTVLALLTISFFVAIALLGMRLYRDYRFGLESLADRDRLVLYTSIAGAFVTFTATNRLFDAGGVGVLLWIALLALCSFGAFYVYMQTRSY